MTDEEFESFQHRLQAGRRISGAILARVAACRDCDRANPESYVPRRDLWLQAVPSGRGRLCFACLARRLGRPLIAEDFGDMPFDTRTKDAWERKTCAR
jgi:hypothetical protein